MDLNIVVVSGTLSVHPQINTFQNGKGEMVLTVKTKSESKMARFTKAWYLTTDDDIKKLALVRGDRVWVSGYLQDNDLIATHVQKVEVDDDES